MVNMSKTQIVFLLSFSVLFLFTLLLGESFLFFIILGAWASFVFIFHSLLQWDKVKHFQVEWLVWCIFLLSLIVSSLFTHHLPMSLYKVSFIAGGFLVFWFFLLIRRNVLKKELIYVIFILNGLVLGVLSLFFLFFPHFAYALPGMNLVFPTYGHNHLASYLLLILPLVWLFYFRAKGNQANLFLALLLVFSFLVLISFGRVATLLGIAQLLVIYLKKRQQSGSINRLLLILGSFFGLIIILQQLISWNVLPCTAGTYQSKICKPFIEEPRGLYWQQALKSFQANLLVGYGPGTFQLVNTKYKQLPSISTSYAHNTLLEFLAESGLISASALVILVATLGWMVAQVPPNDEKFFISLSAVTLLGNSVFDFDFNYLGIYLGLLILVGLLLREKRVTFKLPLLFLDEGRVKKAVRTTFFFLTVVALSLSGLFLVIDGLIQKGRTELAWKIFPYFTFHQKLFVVKEAQLTEAKNLYQYDPLWYQSSKNSLDEEAIIRLLDIDPWGMYYDTYGIIDRELSDQAWSAYLSKVIHLDNQRLSRNPNVMPPSFALRKKLSEKMNDQVPVALAQREIAKAITFYDKAREWDAWIWDRKDLAPQWIEVEPLIMVDFMEHVGVEDPSRFGRNRDEVASIYEQKLQALIQEGKYDRISLHLVSLINITPWNSYTILNSIQSAFREKLTTLEMLEDRQSLLEAWATTLIETEAYKSHYPFTYRLYVATELIDRGQEWIFRDGSITARNYDLVYQLEPWLLSSTPLWFDQYSIQDIPFSQLLKYGENMKNKRDKAIGWRSEDQAVIFARLATELIETERIEDALAMIQAYSEVGPVPLERYRPYQQRLQRLASQHFSDIQFVRDVLFIMKTLDPQNYWSQMQLANYYLVVSQTANSPSEKEQLLAKARQEYQNCLTAFSGAHTDCSLALQMIENSVPEYSKYYQIEEMILNP